MDKTRKRIPEKSFGKAQLKLDHRLSRLGGQVQALRRMVGNAEDWKKMLTLAAAIEGATNQVSADLLQGYLESLLINETNAGKAREGLELVLKRR